MLEPRAVGASADSEPVRCTAVSVKQAFVKLRREGELIHSTRSAKQEAHVKRIELKFMNGIRTGCARSFA